MEVGLYRTTLGFIRCKSSIGQFQIKTYLTYSQVKRHGKVFFEFEYFNIKNQDNICKQNFNTFSTNLYLISLQLNLNSTQLNFNLIVI